MSRLGISHLALAAFILPAVGCGAPPGAAPGTPEPAAPALPSTNREGETWTVADLAKYVTNRGLRCEAEVIDWPGATAPIVTFEDPGGATVQVMRLPTAKRARSEVNQISPTPQMYAWGRFLISGSPPLQDRIRRTLAHTPARRPPGHDPDPTPGVFRPTAEEQDLRDRVNAERAAAKRPPVAASPALFVSTRLHAANMARQRKLENQLDGVDMGGRARAAGYRYKPTMLVSLLARGYSTPQEVLEEWMSRPNPSGHILYDFADVGIGVASDADGEPYWTMVFATPAGETQKPAP